MNTQEQINETNEDDDHEHGAIFWTIFNPEGGIHSFNEVCACELNMYDVSTFPKGAYMIALDVPMMVH